LYYKISVPQRHNSQKIILLDVITSVPIAVRKLSFSDSMRKDVKIGSVADVSQSAGMYSRYLPLLLLLDCSRSIVSPGDHPRPLQAHAIEEKARWKGDNADPSATTLRDSRTILRHIQRGRVTPVLYHQHYACNCSVSSA